MKDTDRLLALCVAELVTISHQLADMRMADFEDTPSLDTVESSLDANSRVIKQLNEIVAQYNPNADFKELYVKD